MVAVSSVDGQLKSSKQLVSGWFVRQVVREVDSIGCFVQSS